MIVQTMFLMRFDTLYFKGAQNFNHQLSCSFLCKFAVFNALLLVPKNGSDLTRIATCALIELHVYCFVDVINTIDYYYEPRRKKPVFGFPTRSDTNRLVQSQKQTRSLEFRI